MAERVAPGGYDQLHHFVSAGVWDAAAVGTELLVQADKLVGGRDAVLVIDDTTIPDQSTTLRVDSSSTDDSRLRGALPRTD
jgi:hypothetical protein